jgi:hypothetical protein
MQRVLCVLVLFYTEKYTNEVRRGNVSLYVADQYISLDVRCDVKHVVGLTGLLQCDSLLQNNRKPELCKVCCEMSSFILANHRQVVEAIE